MTWANLQPTADANIFFVGSVVADDPAGRYPAKMVWEDCPDEVQQGWYKDNGTYREPNPNDEFIGWTNQERKNFVQAVLDDYYWRHLARHENPFDQGNAIYAGVADDAQAVQIALNDAKADRRAYVNNGEPPQDNTIDAILGTVGQYNNNCRSARDAIWTDLKNEVIYYTDVATDPRWPTPPTFIGTADPDAPVKP